MGLDAGNLVMELEAGSMSTGHRRAGRDEFSSDPWAWLEMRLGFSSAIERKATIL